MPTLTVTKDYSGNTPLTQAQLDALKDSVTTFVNTTKLDEDNLGAGCVTTAKLQASAITSAKFDTNSITSAKLSSSASVDADRAVDTTNLVDGSITEGKFADDAVTAAKKELNDEITSSSGTNSYGTGSSSLTDVTNLSRTITVREGAEVLVIVVNEENSTHSSIVGDAASGDGIREVALLRDGTSISSFQTSNYVDGLITSNRGPWLGWSIFYLDSDVAAGEHTYKIQYKANGSASSPVLINNFKLYVKEL